MSKSQVALGEGEELIAEIEAELWAISSNPVAQLFGEILKFIAAILGFKKKGFIVITNKRVVEIYDQINCYVFNTERRVKYLLPSSIKEIGYTKKAMCGLFCPGFYLYYEGLTNKTMVLLKDADESKASKLVDSFYKALKG
ncbi:MAG: hypothetical protein EWM51_01855 [Treponema sp.]|nr:MAG: hypothetical protein EWM51_01855 [Treponema sp.]